MDSARYVVDPADPRAPSIACWNAMSPAERARVVAELPSEIERSTPPEGDFHRLPKERAMDALGEHFRRIRRRIYLSAELPVYYPAEPMFAPDVIAVLDVEPHPRERWVVSDEGKGLDLAIEITVSGDRKKDLERNVSRFARLGIREYFVFAPKELRLVGYRLSDIDSQESPAYQPIVPQQGRWSSRVLGLELGLEQGRIRFFSGTAAVEESVEIIGRLGNLVDLATRRQEELVAELERERRHARAETERAQAETERAQAETERARAETERAERLAAKLIELGIDPESVGRKPG